MENLKIEFNKDYNIESNELDIISAINSVNFWNRSKEEIYTKNQEGEYGSPETQEFARNSTIEEFTLQSLYNDIVTIFRYTDLIFGKGGSHIWVSNDKNKRIFMISL